MLHCYRQKWWGCIDESQGEGGRPRSHLLSRMRNMEGLVLLAPAKGGLTKGHVLGA